jgi:hypothetical protein
MLRPFRLPACLFLALAFALSPLAPLPAAATGLVPAQWIAKVYSEGLGRAPDQTAWANMVAYFQANGCSATSLSHQGQPIYDSTEFSNLGYGNAAKLLSLYRGALDREPDSSGFNSNLNALNGGTSWSSMVNQFFTSSEFNSLASTICTTGSYDFGTAAAIAIPLGASCTGAYCFNGGTQAQLQSMLDSAPSGTTVWLAQQVVVTIDTQSTADNGAPAGLDVPAGRTLATYGQPSTGAYAAMGRLVRASSFQGAPMVEMESGAKLLNVFVDGQRDVPSGYHQLAIDVEIGGGSGTTVSNSRISNTAGWTNLHANGSKENFPCASNTITGNVVTAYSSSHLNQEWSDGLSIACENATVSGNTVIDATDVGIVVFRASPAVQKSQVHDNTVLSAGNSAFGGLVADPLTGVASNPSFAGSSVDHNTLWTGPGTAFDIGLSVGTRPWFTNPNLGTGASFTYNTTGSQSANVTEGITVSGMLNVTVTNNTLTVHLGRWDSNSCPQATIAAAVSAGWASGTIQGPYTNEDVYHCV